MFQCLSWIEDEDVGSYNYTKKIKASPMKGRRGNDEDEEEIVAHFEEEEGVDLES
jgi:hypothetical protein